jgi:hypothetical protein
VKNQNSRSLGPLIAKYKDRQFSWVDIFTLFFPGFLAFAIPGGYAIYLAYYAYSNYGKAAAIYWIIPWLAIAAIAFLVFFILIAYRINLSKRYIAIHQNGIFASFRKKQALSWDQISGISTEVSQKRFLFFKSRLTYKAVIHTTSRDKIRLHPKIEHLPGFISRFKKIFYPVIKPVIEHNLFIGKNVNFGKVSIDRDCFILGQQRIPWSLINQVTVRSGRLVVELTDHSKIKVITSKILNIELLLQFIKQGENS